MSTIQQSQRRNYGDPVPSITRPATTAKATIMQHIHSPSDKRTEADPRNAVESPLAEGDVAAAVEGKTERSRAQAGAHAGPVGSARGPGEPGLIEERDLDADIPQKKREHDEVLGERRERSRSRIACGLDERDDGEEEAEKRERVREEKLKWDREVDVSGAVGQGTRNVVAGR